MEGGFLVRGLCMVKKIKIFCVLLLMLSMALSSGFSSLPLYVDAEEDMNDEIESGAEDKSKLLIDEIEGLEGESEPKIVAEGDIYIDDSMLEYNGEAQWPNIIYGDCVLNREIDYTIECIDTEQPVNAGIYNINITMKGNYASDNPIQKSFEIHKANVMANDLVTPSFEVYCDSIIINEPLIEYEYQIGEVDFANPEAVELNGNWVAVDTPDNSIVFDKLLPGKPYYICYRLKETENYKASDIAKYMVSTLLQVGIIGDSSDNFKSRTVGHVLEAEVLGENVNGEQGESYIYSWYRDEELVSEGNQNVYEITKKDIGHMIMVEVVREAPYETYGKSQEVLAVAPQITSEQASYVIDIDYKNEIISFKEDGYFELAFDANAKTGTAKLTDLSPVINKKSFNIYVRNIADIRENEYIYSWVAMSISGRPDAPSVAIKNASGKDKKDGIISSKTTGLEYKLKSDSKYTELTSSTKLVPGIYLVRVAATDSSFAGKDKEVTISYTGNVVAKASKRPTSRGRLTYNGQSQELVNRGASDEGTVLYATEKDGSYSTAVPTAKKPGTYIVWWKIKADSAHTDSNPLSIVTMIAKKQLSVKTPITATKLYDGTTAVSIDWNKIGLSGVINNEDVSITGKAEFEDSNVGINKRLRITNLNLVGADKDNYSLSTASILGVGSIRDNGINTGQKAVPENNGNVQKTASAIKRNSSKANKTNDNKNDGNVIEVQNRLDNYFDAVVRKPNIYSSRIVLPNNIEGKLISKYLSPEDITIEDKYLIDDAIRNMSIWIPNLEILDYMDISIYEPNDEVGWINVAETAEPVKMVITLEDEQVNNKNTYHMIRVHNGEAKFLSDEDEDDRTVTISSNEFSTYVLLAQGPEVPLSAPIVESAGKGDSTFIVCLILGILLSVMLLIVKRKSQQVDCGM